MGEGDSEQPRPIVTLAGGTPDDRPPDVVDSEPPRRGQHPAAAAAVALGLVVLLAAVQPDAPPAPAPTPRVAAELTLVPDALTTSQTGVLVVPVRLQDLGPGLSVVSAQAYAAPVREDPAVDPPVGVRPGEDRQFVVLLSPDCRLLTPRSGLTFRASLLVQVANGDATQQLVLDLDGGPGVQDVVRGLCGR